MPPRDGAAAPSPGRGRRFPLRLKIVASLLPALLPLLAVVMMGYWSGSSAALTASAGIAGLIAEDGGHEIGDFLRARRRQVEQWTADDTYGAAIAFDAVKELGKAFKGQLDQDRDFAALVLTDPQGNVLQAAGRGTVPPLGKPCPEWRLHRVGAGRLEVLVTAGAAWGGRRTLVYCFDTRSDDKINGTLLAYLDPAALAAHIDALAPHFARHGLPSGVALLVDGAERSVLARTGPAAGGTDDAEQAAIAWLDASRPEANTLLGGQRRLARYGAIADSDWLGSQPAAATALPRLGVLVLAPESDLLAAVRTTTYLDLALAGVGSVIIVLMVLVAGDRISRPVRSTAALLQDIATGDGDLTRTLAVRSRDELGDLAYWFNAFVANLRGIVGRVGGTAQDLDRSVGALNGNARSMLDHAQATSEQTTAMSADLSRVSGEVQAVAVAVGQIDASITSVAGNAASAAGVAREAVAAVGKANATIGRLDAASSEIDKVVKLIAAVAVETNLLALNAAIEAARAGASGRGFAVVAHNVKELAQATSDSTTEIAAKVDAIQTSVREVVAAMGGIKDIIARIDDISRTIASAAEEQSATMREINARLDEAAKASAAVVRSVGQVAGSIAGTTEGARQTRVAADALAQVVSDLRALVGKFKY
jgi:methyl-accepting chemotaxis protein